jgi:hypothetical protein
LPPSPLRSPRPSARPRNNAASSIASQPSHCSAPGLHCRTSPLQPPLHAATGNARGRRSRSQDLRVAPLLVDCSVFAGTHQNPATFLHQCADLAGDDREP